MSGFSLPTIGQPNSTEAPKIAAILTGANDQMQSYVPILDGSGNYPASNSGTRYFLQGSSLQSSAILGAGIRLIYLAASDGSVTGLTQKLRLRAQQATTSVGPGTTLTVGLYPVTAVSAGALTVGSVVSGSTVAFASTAANTLAQGNSGDFTFPSDGYYIVGVANSGTTAASSPHDLFFQLQRRWV